MTDTIPPTATIFSEQNYTSAEKIAIDVTFSEACTGKGGFTCLNSSICDVSGFLTSFYHPCMMLFKNILSITMESDREGKFHASTIDKG